MKDPRIVDPRVARSHQRLRDAMFELTLERGWDAISVQQLCERAGVGRSTFYVHFADREELLLSALQRRHIIPGALHGVRPLGFVRPLVEHVAEHRVLYDALVGTSCERAMRRRFQEVIGELLEAELARRAAPSTRRATALRYLSGAWYEALTFWLEQRCSTAPCEIENLLTQFSTPVIERAAG